MKWGAPQHYVLRNGEWFKCPRDCGGMCGWRPGEVMNLADRRSTR